MSEEKGEKKIFILGLKIVRYTNKYICDGVELVDLDIYFWAFHGNKQYH